jgi:sortase A
MRALRHLELLSWSIGLILLSIHGVVRWRNADSYDDALAAFADARSAEAVASIASDTNRPVLDESVDTTTWSARRIEKYRESLHDERLPEAIVRIPALGLVVPVFEGTSERNLNRGAGRIEGTARIGAPGNIGIAAHRDGFFRALKDIRIGDALFLERMATIDEYRVVSTSIVEPTNVAVLDPTSTPTVTLVTCHPFYYVGAAPQRFIVRADLAARRQR